MSQIVDLIVSFSKISEYRDFFDVFFHDIMMYYINFPLKSQSVDNKKSIFEETSFKHFISGNYELVPEISNLDYQKSLSSPNQKTNLDMMKKFSEKTSDDGHDAQTNTQMLPKSESA